MFYFCIWFFGFPALAKIMIFHGSGLTIIIFAVKFVVVFPEVILSI